MLNVQNMVILQLKSHFIVKETSGYKNNLINGFLALKLVKKEILFRFLDPFIFSRWLIAAILDFLLYRSFPGL